MNQRVDTLEYERLVSLVRDVTGMDIGPSKAYLLETRLGPLLGEFECETYGQLVNLAHSNRSLAVREAIVDAITTNETLWFRDNHPFDAIKNEVLPSALTDHNNPIQIWSAASSTGQEAYSLAMLCDELGRERSDFRTRDIRIFGTDISPAAIKTARTGIYSDMEISRGLSTERKARFFAKVDRGYQLTTEIRSKVTFREGNLLSSTEQGSYDLVMLRNVLIYFSTEARQRIVSRVARQMRPGAYLFVGATESLSNLDVPLQPTSVGRSVVFRKTGDGR